MEEIGIDLKLAVSFIFRIYHRVKQLTIHVGTNIAISSFGKTGITPLPPCWR